MIIAYPPCGRGYRYDPRMCKVTTIYRQA